MNRFEYQRIFQHFDSDRDGKISPAEVCRCIKSIGGEISVEEAKTVVESLDMDGDGMLGLEDFIALMESEQGEEGKMRDLRDAFELYQTDGSKCITAKSLKRMLSRLGESKTIEECEFMINRFDLDGDGQLNFEEFKAMMKRI